METNNNDGIGSSGNIVSNGNIGCKLWIGKCIKEAAVT
jgi:hypothetical protein